MPKVSVVMSCYNEFENVGSAIESILNQTYSTFEFIIIDDGSTDETPSVIQQYAERDNRINAVFLKYNQGLSNALNAGIATAQGQYIARMDADDLALPDRLARQVSYLDRYPNIDVLGGNALLVSAQNESESNVPLTHEEITSSRYKKTFLIHPSVMAKSSLFGEFGQYDNALPWAEDKDLWLRWMAKGVVFANLPDVLLKYKVKTKLTPKIIYYNHKVLVTNMYRQGELFSNFYWVLRSFLSQLLRLN